jgi:hypothetical protein
MQNEYHFYMGLCDELLNYAQNMGVKVYMSARKQREVDILRQRYDIIRAIDNDRQKLRNMKTLFADITRFYEKRYPLHVQSETQRTSTIIIINWRWQHLLERAQRWQEIAKRHDWSHDLQIQPRYPSQERWWIRTPSSAVGLFAENNPYTIEGWGIKEQTLL